MSNLTSLSPIGISFRLLLCIIMRAVISQRLFDFAYYRLQNFDCFIFNSNYRTSELDINISNMYRLLTVQRDDIGWKCETNRWVKFNISHHKFVTAIKIYSIVLWNYKTPKKLYLQFQEAIFDSCDVSMTGWDIIYNHLTSVKIDSLVLWS